MLGFKASSICSKLKRLSKPDVQVLKSLYPSTSATKRPRFTFDPSAECVAAAQQKKKKAAVRFKSSKITVIAVDGKKPILKGKWRKELKKGLEQVIEVKRNFTSQQIKNEIYYGIWMY